MDAVILYEVWINSQLSIARYSGGAMINGELYQIYGNHNDLVKASMIPAYNHFGRKRLIELLDSGKTEKEVVGLMKDEKKEKKKATIEKNAQRIEERQISLF